MKISLEFSLKLAWSKSFLRRLIKDGSISIQISSISSIVHEKTAFWAALLFSKHLKSLLNLKRAFLKNFRHPKNAARFLIKNLGSGGLNFMRNLNTEHLNISIITKTNKHTSQQFRHQNLLHFIPKKLFRFKITLFSQI